MDSFVCVTSEKLRKHFRFRSYESSRDVIDDCLIWEACRATSAAPTLFPPMMIGNPSIAYVDGGLGYNNPIRPLMEEAAYIWPERKIGSIVSIGTGVPEGKDVGRRIRPLFETLKAMSVDTEKVAREFKADVSSKHLKQNPYFRFNVLQGLGQVGLEEWKELDRTKIATEDYLNEHWDEVSSCASRICKSSGTLE
jgi:predicted acylesterase/phospholipase RssA